jgi:hypothetical protein
MTTTPHDTALRTLDAAVGAPDGADRRAELLERIVATPAPPEHAPRRRRQARLVLVPVAVAALVLGALVLRDDDGSGVAYASWTAAPSAVSADDLEAVIEACRDQLGDRDIPVVLAERRGDYVAVLFHRDVPDTASSCVATNRPGSDRVDDVAAGTGGSSGPAWTPPAGRITEGMISQHGGDRPAAFTEGAVGPGVVGVTIHAGPQTVTATVANGRYAAWWPGQAFAPFEPQPSGEGGPEPMLVYDVHLADGSVERGVAPARPS